MRRPLVLRPTRKLQAIWHVRGAPVRAAAGLLLAAIVVLEAKGNVLAQETPKMREMVRREQQLPDGEKLIAILSDSEKYSVVGRSDVSGHFTELRLVTVKGSERSDKTVYRVFGPDPPWVPPHKVCDDIAIDATTGDIFLCSARRCVRRLDDSSPRSASRGHSAQPRPLAEGVRQPVVADPFTGTARRTDYCQIAQESGTTGHIDRPRQNRETRFQPAGKSHHKR